MTRNTTQQIGVVVILASQPIAIMIQLKRQIDLMAATAEFSRAVQWFQERLLVEGWFCLHQLIVDPLQQLIVAVSKRIVLWFFNRKVSVADVAVDVSNCMTHRACDSRLGCRMFQHVKVWIIECSTEEWNRIMTASTETGPLDVAVSLHTHFASFRDTGKVGGVVERTEVMSTVCPFLVRILVALQAVLIHIQSLCWNEVAR